MINPADKFIRSDAVTHADVENESILLHFERGEYFGLNAVGQTIWEALETPHSLDEVVSHVMNEYEADEAVIRADVTKLFDELCTNGIIVAAQK
ncbi:MAG: PqqD family protein [Pseudomonadota bacterium]